MGADTMAAVNDNRPPTTTSPFSGATVMLAGTANVASLAAAPFGMRTTNRPLPTPLIGRDAEMVRLREGLRDASRGRVR